MIDSIKQLLQQEAQAVLNIPTIFLLAASGATVSLRTIIH